MNSGIKHVLLVHICYICREEFTKQANLRRHYKDVEMLDLPSTNNARIYNTKHTKFISKAQSQTFSDFTTGYPCLCCTEYRFSIEELGNHITAEHLTKLEQDFIKLDSSKKWKLSSGRTVENVLFKFAKSCTQDHPACSLIIDPEDKTYTKYKLFTDKEMNEIKTTKLKTFIERLPPDFANYLNNSNLSCAKELREQLQQPNDWEFNYDIDQHHDIDWAKHTIYTYLRLYESQALEDMHEESWYNSRVWFLLDTAFDDIKSLQVVRGECVSAASAKRKNQDRVIGSLEKIERTKIGHKCDMIIREKKEKHEYVYEYCVGESKPRYESTSTIEERAIKLPKSMKDMLDALIRYNHDVHDDLAVFGVQHTGLTITFLAADRPSPYITRINHVTSKQISSNISLFGATVLPVVVLVWQIKQQVIMMKSKILASQSNQARQRSEWLQHCLDPEPQTAIPTTSSSTEFVSKKRKTNKQ